MKKFTYPMLFLAISILLITSCKVNLFELQDKSKKEIINRNELVIVFMFFYLDDSFIKLK